MAEITTGDHDLSRRLHESRDGINRPIAEFRRAADVPDRLRRSISTHPFTWAAIALVGGAVIVRLVPAAFAILRLGASGKLVRSAIAGVAPALVRAGMAALASRRHTPVIDARGELPP